MEKNYLIGVDLGTSSTKAALYEHDGRLVASAVEDVPIYYPRPGVVEQENDDFYNSAARTVRACLHESGVDPRRVAAIAFDSQMAGIGAVDEDFNPAIRFDSWLDMRCQPYIHYIDEHYGDLVTRLTGCPPTCDHGPKILWWKEEQPESYRRIARFVTPAGYVAGKMAGLRGGEAFMDNTFLHFTGYSDAQRGAWSEQLCSLLGVDMGKLPRIVDPWQVIGEVSEAAAADFGLAAGTPIAAGCGDTAANALGAGITRPGMRFDAAGTAAVLAGCTDRFVADTAERALLTMRSVIPGLWHPLAYIAGGGIALRWFRDQFYNVLRGEAQDLPDDLYAVMIAEAQNIPPGADGLFFSPHLGGRICPSAPQMRGAWLGFSWGHTQAHFVRAVLESVAYEYAYYLGILRRLIPDLDLIEARVGGGGARSPVWNQIKADVLGVPYRALQGGEFGTWGAAMIAGKAAGMFADLAATAEAHVRPDGQTRIPNLKDHNQYREIVAKHIAWQLVLEKAFD
ncbi:MAG TPA: FGGY family carbohydrate kinase [Anaerolinea sp.]|nr:FGGY family carbohydrate kinase [Anaerolinea sp.]